MYLPLKKLPDVWHIGSLIAEENDPTSYEGNLLSVSTCPDSWQSIAKLSGDLWKFSCPNAFFLDAHAFMKNEASRAAVLFWADAKGLIEQKTVYDATHFEDDLGRDLTFTFESMEDLEREFDPETVVISERKFVPVMTDKALEKYQLKRNGIEYETDYVLMDWVEAKLLPHDARIKGLWWEDEMNPERLSAPRGGIFPKKLEDFMVRREVRTSEEVEADAQAQDAERIENPFL